MTHFFILTMLFTTFFTEPTVEGPQQAIEGPGSAVYAHDSVLFQDYAQNPDGYWLFEPASPKPEKAPVVVFTHGYGAYNPMIYGKWIKHIVRRGNIVIFPRYQKNILSPNPKHFANNVAIGIRDALKELETGDHVRPTDDPLVLVGHSYGGAISAYLGVNYDTLNIPKPAGIMLVSPGTGPFSGAKLDDYAEMPEDVKLLIVVSDKDRVVGDRLGRRIFNTAINTPQRNLLVQYGDDYGEPNITAGHNESYSLDEEFDTGIRNVSSKRALGVSKLDAVDYYGYWKLFDALAESTRTGQYLDYAFGDTPEQRFMGLWSDGTPVKPLKVHLPEIPTPVEASK
jgi:pimeloyl-ACP methyl ester carboxylesterase